MLGIYHEAQRESPGVFRRVKEEHGENHEKQDQGTPFRQRRRVYKWPFPTALPRWGYRKILHSKGNTATKRGGWKDEHDLIREGSVHVIQHQFIKNF